ncbi:putative hydrolase of the HAD superfamily [Bacillus pakistanensis]|uniref:Phosphoserine phosphatase n=1 Tax=Rossellomorea pakistanensis TaxID=992288 RepID=A0ABS2N891_9BACI|nr:HAD family hydrolase [Bacillus pakistanensis]MBM7584038.1 putative hydrolase of the HAD superfamily [Bacillus pakistanensis]
MIKAIMFDLDDTLLWDNRSINEAFAATCTYANKVSGVDAVSLEEAVKNEAKELYASYETYEFTKLIGINPFEGLWGEFLDEHDEFPKLKEIVPSYRKSAWNNGLMKLKVDDEELAAELANLFINERRSKPYIFDETFKTLDELKDRYQLLLLTNGSPHLQNSKLTLTPQLIPYFDEIIISGDFGKGKPDDGIFKYALSKLNVNENEAIMVGDNLMTDILGANRSGIKSVWINRNNQKYDQVIPNYEIHSLDELHRIIEIVN